MPTPKLQPSRALAVIPSNTCRIPMPSPQVSGTATGATSTTLTDSGVDFVAKGIAPGFIMYSSASGSAAVVKSVTTHTLTFETAVTVSVSDAYQVYAKPEGEDGCVLYVGTQGNLTVTTAGGDDVTFVGVVGFLPVNVIKVLSSTTATDIVALW